MDINNASNAPVEDSLNYKDLKKSLEKISLCTYKYPEFPKHKSSWFEKLMNKLSWYRQTTVYVVDFETFKDLACFSVPNEFIVREAKTSYQFTQSYQPTRETLEKLTLPKGGSGES